jgi:hypothetical protein
MNARQAAASEMSANPVSWINVILGIWVIISPYILEFSRSAPALWNNVATGAATGIIALIRSALPEQSGWSWLNVILGIMLIISPFALGFISMAAFWNNIILGIIVICIAWGGAARRVQPAV